MMNPRVDTSTVVGMTSEDSDHQVTGPMKGNRFALLSDDRSEELNEQLGPNHVAENVLF